MQKANEMCDKLINEFTENYMGKLFYFCLKKTGNNVEAEDLTQDIALQIITALNKGTIPTSFSAWVWQIARNRYAHWADGKHRRAERTDPSDMDDLALPAIVGGVIGLMLARREITRGAWRTLLGFGFLFFGMTMMSHELKSVAKLPSFISFFSLFDCTPSASGFLPFGSILGAIAVGTLCTMLVQSSSATVGMLQTVAQVPGSGITFAMAYPVIMGINLGTCVTTAMVCSIGSSKDAKRTGVVHIAFNTIGTILFMVVMTVMQNMEIFKQYKTELESYKDFKIEDITIEDITKKS